MSEGRGVGVRAGLYVRISRDYEGKRLGVKRQEEDCRRHAESRGWDVVEVYVDNDVSATKSKARKQYERMLEDVRAGELGAMVAWHPDRLYRKVTDLAELVAVCKETGAQISTVNAGHIDLSTPTGRLIAGLLAQVAMYEVEHKSERYSRSWRQGRERGAPVTNSHRLYGYERDGVTIVPVEADVIRRMAKELLTGASMYSLVAWLDENEIRTSLGGVFSIQGLKRVLLNPRIAGYSTHKGEIIAEGQWDPILDRETWEEIRALMQSRSTPGQPRVALLGGLIVCGLCGVKLIRSTTAGRVLEDGSRARRAQYRCPGDRPNLRGCGKLSGSADPIEEIAEAYAQAKIADLDLRARINRLQAEPSGAQKELVVLDGRIKELELQLDQPGTPVATILRAIDRAKERQDVLLNRLADAPRVPLPTSGRTWPKDLERRRALVAMTVEKVILHPRLRPTNKFNPERVEIVPRPQSS